jgi:pSer/pThr/pTyr-binding forkhead associated (FHA) protein
MIETNCQCGSLLAAPESSVGAPVACDNCGQTFQIIAGESLDEGNGAGDFDARLVIEDGPQRVGEQLLLGGVQEITIGKLPDKNIVLHGSRVSRLHCKLSRLDFGPSRWQIQDNRSTNGLFVNDEKIDAQELQNGDAIAVGEYRLRYRVMAELPPPPVAQAVATTAAPAQKLNYSATRQNRREQPLLGDCDVAWVMSLRNASVLMVWVININFLTWLFLPRVQLLETGVELLTALMSWAAAWMLTAAEPEAPESQSWFSVRLFLRVAATITVVGEVLAIAGVLLENDVLKLPGGILYLMIVPQTFLFLYYLRRLAVRIPSTALAINIVIVMVGLPLALLATVGGVLLAAISNSPGMAILTGAVGVLALIVFRIWYLILLIWFNKSFS